MKLYNKNKSAVLVSALVVWGVAAPLYLQASLVVSNIRASMAIDQVAIITSYVDHGDGVVEGMTRRETVEAIRGYYPSGTKQLEGSKLDRLVESYRALAIRYVEECAAEIR